MGDPQAPAEHLSNPMSEFGTKRNYSGMSIWRMNAGSFASMDV